MKSHGHRKFYHIPESTEPEESKPDLSFDKTGSGILDMIRKNVIGRDTVFHGPFGPRKCCYMDKTASGQSIRCIEDFIQENVTPYYGNTHTTTTLTASQTTMFRDEARDIIRNYVGASEHDAVIFCGSGATNAVHKLVEATTGHGDRPPPVVFIGPFEHHSNILPWREIGAKMVYIPETEDGCFDMKYLETKLAEAKADGVKNRLLIGSFSVASNVTGIVVDDVAITILMHKFGGLAFWDYAAGAPHLEMKMNPVVTTPGLEGMAKKDAMFFSGHKFTPQTPGVLVVKKSVLENPVPNGCGGGTVFFVTQDSHRYLKNAEHREEGGTPAIIESIRLGLYFRLLNAIGDRRIIEKHSFMTKAFKSWSDVPEIKVLGSKVLPRVAIVSFMIDHPESGYYLHYNFVVALLNDLFGIQSRGGCMCAGPYGQHLLGIDLPLSYSYERLLLEDSRLDRDHLRRQHEGSSFELFRPGFVRISVPFYASEEEENFVIEAVKLIAKEGYKLLPLYICNPETGEFHHYAKDLNKTRKWLGWIKFDSDGLHYRRDNLRTSPHYPSYDECLEEAQLIFKSANHLSKRRALSDQSNYYDAEALRLKWFLLPSEALRFMNMNNRFRNTKSLHCTKPFTVRNYDGKKPPRRLTPHRSSALHQVMMIIEEEEEPPVKLDTSSSSSLGFKSSNDSINSLGSTPKQNMQETFIPAGTTVTGPSICFKPQISKGVTHTVDKLNGSSGSIDGNISHENLSQTTHHHNNMTSQSSSDSTFSDHQPPFSTTESIAIVQNTNNHNNANFANFSISNTVASPGVNCYGNGSNCRPHPPIGSTQAYYLNSSGSTNSVFTDTEPTYSPTCNVNGFKTYTYSSASSNTSSDIAMMSPSYSDNSGLPNNQMYYVGTRSPVFQNSDLSNSSAYHSGPCIGSPSISGQSPIPSQSEYLGEKHFPNVSPRGATSMPVVMENYTNNNTPGMGGSSNSLPILRDSDSPTMHDEMVHNAMRRVTTELANELKSEIREVISQVEQGMDPDGTRERSNSFNIKGNNKVDSFKGRTRSLSGEAFKSNPFKKHRGKCLLRFNDPGIEHYRREKEAKRWMAGESEDSDFEVDKDILDEEVEIEESFEIGDKMDGLFLEEKEESEKEECNIRGSNAAPASVAKWHHPTKKILKPTLKALREFSMLKDGDKVLICVSGGKDSLSLLHTMKQAQYALAKEKIRFTMGAVTVDPKHSGFDPSPLIPYMESLGIPYFFEEQCIMQTAMEKGPEEVSSICSFCSRLKRGRLYNCARKNGYNVLALGQHLDDLAESFLMTVFHNGLLRTMKASYTVKEGDLRVIRPFVNVREKALRDFAESRGLPIIPENCPACFEAPTERVRVKQLLAQQELIYPNIYVSLRSAMQPLMAVNKTGMESRKTINIHHRQNNDDQE